MNNGKIYKQKDELWDNRKGDNDRGTLQFVEARRCGASDEPGRSKGMSQATTRKQS